MYYSDFIVVLLFFIQQKVPRVCPRKNVFFRIHNISKRKQASGKKTYRTLFKTPKQNCMRNLERFWQSSILRKIPNALFPPNPSIIHICILSQTVRESPGYRPNLLLTRTGYLISQREGIKAHKIHSQTYFGQFWAFCVKSGYQHI